MIFGNNELTTDLSAISEELIRSLPSELGDPYGANKPWTKAVKTQLDAMGKTRGLMVCCHGSQDHEWLLDVVWMVAKEHKIVLAVESEWGTLAQVEDDFDKLMSIKARSKLMLFNTNNHRGAEIIVNKLESNMRVYPYHLAGEEYMLLEVTAPGAFRYYFKVPSDGHQNDAIFEALGEPLPWPWKP